MDAWPASSIFASDYIAIRDSRHTAYIKVADRAWTLAALSSAGFHVSGDEKKIPYL